MSTIINFPPNLRISDRSDPQLMFNTRSGGIAMDGSEQILSPLSERWEWRVIIPVNRGGEVRAARIIKSLAKGRFNYLRIPVCDQYRISRRDIGAWSPDDPATFSDGSFFADGTGMPLAQPSSPVTVAAAINAQTVTVRASDFNDGITAGVFFSINDYLYHLDAWELSGANYVLSISPPLRAAVAVDDVADFDAKALWRFGSDSEGRLDLRIGRHGTIELNLVEPVGR